MSEIVTLSLNVPAQKAEALAVLKRAFASHPFMPEGSPPEATDALLDLLFDTFGQTDRAWLHGIRMDGQLACVAFSYDAHYTPPLRSFLSFARRLGGIFGWRRMARFLVLLRGRPRHKARYLELFLLGTDPAHHGKGMGRTLMRFLYDFATAEGFRGLLLDVVRETPAFRFYEKEGFVTDKEQTMNGKPLCHMRREPA